jgi:hypothetical protein
VRCVHCDEDVIVRRSDCLLLPMVSCPVMVVMMLESRVVKCVHCDEDVIVRRSDCLLLPMVSYPVIVVMMLGSRVVRCVHCVEDVAGQHPPRRSTLTNITRNQRQ